MTERNYLAIYFRMGQLEEGDRVSPELIGFDCPFDDSPVLFAENEEELERKIREVHTGDYGGFVNREWHGVDWRGIYPDVISDNLGNILVDLYRKITSEENFNPDIIKYSFGRETLTQLWEREKGRWILINPS
ncbi:hypothetical protein HY494_03205 [Candidatus Woesearchaeota archaeon]|nr:hypothetical protein [Candidatus Woesearchaeota archaeon]